MTKVPNILDWLSVMRDEEADEQKKRVLGEAYILCARQLAGLVGPENAPPSWPLNLDEWELWEGHTMPEGTGWWLLHTAEKLRCVRRRKARAEQVTLSEEER